MKTQETLCDCGHIAVSDGFTTGYGWTPDNKKHCFACCGENDRKELETSGKLHGYFSVGFFQNWPGTFKIKAYATKQSWHNFAGKDGRTDFWLLHNGRNYHGVQIGHNNECATIRVTK